MKSVSLWRPSKSEVLNQGSGDHNHNLIYQFLLLKLFAIIAEYIFSVLFCVRQSGPYKSKRLRTAVINGLICKRIKKNKNTLLVIEIVEINFLICVFKLYWRYIILKIYFICSFSILKFHIQLNVICSFFVIVCELCSENILFLQCKNTAGKCIGSNMVAVIMSSLFDHLFTVWWVW